MKAKTILALAALALMAGCSSPGTQYGKKQVNVLGGLVKVEQGGYVEQGPLTIGEKSSTFHPGARLDGDSVTLFWGLITYVDN